MQRVRVLVSFIQLSMALKLLFYKNVIANMDGNPLFAAPDVKIIDLTAAVTQFEANLNQAQTGLKEATIKLRQSIKVADELFRKMAKYVDRIADGNVAIIESSGFVANRLRGPRSNPLFSVENGKFPNQIILHCKAVKGARSYCWQYAKGSIPVSDEGWVYAGVSTQTTFTKDNLESLSKYWFRYCAVKSTGMTAWSDPIMKIVI